MRISDWSSDVCSSDLTGADERSSLNVHFILLGKNVDYTVEISVQIDRIVQIERREQRENIGLDARDQQLEAADPDHQRHAGDADARSEEHTSELQSLMRISYAVFCLKKKNKLKNLQQTS